MGDEGVGVSVAVVGILSPDFGCSCEHHEICGKNVHLDMAVRFKSAVVEGGPRGYTGICGVYWVTDGTDRCLIGRVGDEFKPFFKRLEGRVAQVVEIFPCSNEPKKLEYSTKRHGVCHAMLIDRLVDGDMAMMDILDLVEESCGEDEDDDKGDDNKGDDDGDDDNKGKDNKGKDKDSLDKARKQKRQKKV